MSLLSFIGEIFKPAAALIDDLHTSEEERGKLANELATIQNNVMIKALELQEKMLAAQSQIITAEAQGQSWLQRNWRPITMLTFLVLVVLDSFGLLANRLAPEAWLLLQIGLGGYVIGRTAEKSLKEWKRQ